MKISKPRIVVSKCLEFDQCRYNGLSINDSIIRSLKDYVEFIPICPEVEIGLGTPRDPIRLCKRKSIKLMITHYRFINILFLLFINGLLYAQNNSVSGFITDQETGEALIGANVFIQETGNGMSTDRNGYYVIQNINPGNYNLIVSYIGYNTSKKEINVTQNESIKMDLSLEVEALEISEVEVSAEKLQRKNNIQPSTINLSPRIIKAAPALAEPDIFRTIQALPGVLTNNEASTGLVIRGGNTDQNLILLD